MEITVVIAEIRELMKDKILMVFNNWNFPFPRIGEKIRFRDTNYMVIDVFWTPEYSTKMGIRIKVKAL